jgi:hypothetical protein
MTKMLWVTLEDSCTTDEFRTVEKVLKESPIINENYAWIVSSQSVKLLDASEVYSYLQQLRTLIENLEERLRHDS